MRTKKADAIVVQKLTKRYGDREVLKGVTLKVQEGEFYALMGPNGSGKTTLTSIIASVRQATSGRVEIFGKPAFAARHLISYIPQENFSSTFLTGKENLRYFAKLLGYSAAESKELVGNILEKIQLKNDADRRVSQYSGGMRKRLEIGTALFPCVKVFLLDEPTTGLDPSARRNFLGLLSDFSREGITILMTTHIGTDAEAAAKLGMMDEGRIIAEGTPEELKESSSLDNVVNVETAIKSQKVADVLREFSEDKTPLETDTGYRVYSKDPDKATPEIVRRLDKLGCRVIRIDTDRPTLEEVFYTLTQKPLKGDESF